MTNPLEIQIGELLRTRRLKLATAESGLEDSLPAASPMCRGRLITSWAESQRMHMRPRSLYSTSLGIRCALSAPFRETVLEMARGGAKSFKRILQYRSAALPDPAADCRINQLAQRGSVCLPKMGHGRVSFALKAIACRINHHPPTPLCNC